MIAELSARALRSDREQQKKTYEHRATRDALTQMTADFEEVANFANALYETSQRMGGVIDYLLKERGVKTDQEAQSFEFMLNAVLRQLEAQDIEQSDDSNDPRRGGQEEISETTAAHSAK